MDIEAGFKFVIFLIIFGVLNYFIMLARYKYHLKETKMIKKNKISKLYPKNTFITIKT